MSESNVSSSYLSKLNNTRAGRLGAEIHDITGATLGDFYAEARIDSVFPDADCYRCSGRGPLAGSQYLLKYYRSDRMLNRDAVSRLSMIQSPCLLPVSCVGEYEGHEYTAHPWQSMPALSEVLASGNRFSEEELRAFVIPSVIEGLRAAHEAGIFRTDLRPECLVPDSTGARIILTGVSVTEESSGSLSPNGAFGLNSSPEGRLRELCDNDYFQLGGTLFKLVTGYYPESREGHSWEELSRAPKVRLAFPESFPRGLRDLITGLAFRDRQGGSSGHSGSGWGYNEVKKWLAGEDAPLPQESPDLPGAAGFLPYSFAGEKHTDVTSLVRALLKNPAEGMQETGKGILTHHFGLFDSKAEQICRDAEEGIRNSPDDAGARDVFYRAMYALAPDLQSVFCAGREFKGLSELGEASFEAASSGNRDFAAELEKLLDSILEFYAGSILKNPAAATVLKSTKDIISRYKYSGLQLCWIIGYAFSKRRALMIHGQIFAGSRDLMLYLKKLETEQGSLAFAKYIEEASADLSFFASCHPDSQVRRYLSEVLDELNRAIFGKGELSFKNAKAFDEYIARLLQEKQTYQVRRLLSDYGSALKEVSEKIWHSSSYDNLVKIARGFVPFDELLFASQADLRDYLRDLLEKHQSTPEFFREYVKIHGSALDKAAGVPDLSRVARAVLNLGHAAVSPQECITVRGVRYPTVPPLNAREGDYIKFGVYPYDEEGNAAPIDWLVLKVKDHEALLITRYGIDCRPYHHESSAVTWESCDLRKWLNKVFLKTAFDQEELMRIKVSDLWNDRNPDYDTPGGNRTQDAVFCLSIAETREFFADNAERQCKPTPYARQRGAWGDTGNNCCFWWTRSPGRYENYAALVRTDGVPSLFGLRASFDYDAVRPALRIMR
ncbi:MAG: serine/threonine protein kinase [Succinimonas sp.]|nr:serine/threonine protein kinase [Succinimonas sp.]